MVSYMVVHISNNNEIHKVPQSYYDESRTITQFANTTILEVVLFYEVLNRKPEKLINIEFNRHEINSEASVADIDDCNVLINFNNYGFCDAEKLSLHNEIPIPRAYTSPTEKEKQVIYDFLKNKYPVLWKDCPYITEARIKQQNDRFEEYKELVKKAYLKKI